MKGNDNFCELIDINLDFGVAASACTLVNLRNSAVAGTYQILRDALYHNCGYVAWAHINKESFLRLSRFGVLPKYPYEWDEGQLVLVTEALQRGQSQFAIRKILTELFRKKRVVIFYRKQIVRVYARQGGRFRLMSACKTSFPA